MKPDISVVMVDGLFRESFHAVDFFCNQSLSRDRYELIWVEFFDRVNPELEEKIAGYPNARIVTLNHKDAIYHSSYCFNAGIQESRGEVLFLPDADIAVQPDFLEEALKEHRSDDKLVMYFFRKEEPESSHTSDVSLDRLREVCRFSNPSNYGGCLSVRKSWLLEINGYEQHPVFGSGFHANGLDVYTRLKNLGLHVMWHPRQVLYHPWHPLHAAGAPVWKVQQVIINNRAMELSSLAYQGIDPSRNSDVPGHLLKKLERAKKRHGLDKFFDASLRLTADPGRFVRRRFFGRLPWPQNLRRWIKSAGCWIRDRF